MSAHVEHVILPELLQMGRGRKLRTGLVADLLGYSRRQVYNFFTELERAGMLERKPGGKVWRLA